MRNKVPSSYNSAAALRSSVRLHMRRASPFVLALAPVFAGQAFACGCSKPMSIYDSHVMKYAAVIFEGDVVDVSTPDSSRVVFVKFKVTNLVRGALNGFAIIEIHKGGTSCDLEGAEFQVGEHYLISGTESNGEFLRDRAAKFSGGDPTRYYNNMCGLRIRLDVTPNTSPERTREE